MSVSESFTEGTPSLAVVIPTLGRPTLSDQLEALSSCWWSQPWEIIVADNSADLRSRSTCDEWAERLPQLRHIDASGRPGRSYATNIGARHAAAPNLLFVDDDDEAHEGIIVERVGDALVAGARVVVFNLDVCSLNASHVWRSCDHRQLESERPMFRSIPAVWGCAGIERDVFLDVGGFDESFPYAEDLEFSIRLHEATGIVPLWIPAQLLRYRLRANFAGRFRQRAKVQEALVHLSSRYPQVVAPVARNRYKGVASDITGVLARLPGGLGAQRRLELADQLGAAWGRFVGSGGSSSANELIAESGSSSL